MTGIKHKSQRVAIFIDTQNIYHSARHMYDAKVNFGEVVKQAVGDRELIRAFAYAVTTEAGDETAFLDALQKQSIEVRSKDLQVFAGGAKKGDWDVGLAIDAVRLAPKIDVAVIVSGDGDFVPLVEYLQYNAGCRVEVIAFKRSSSSKLVEAVEHFIDMDEDTDNFLIGTRPKRKRGSQKNNTASKNNNQKQSKNSG